MMKSLLKLFVPAICFMAAATPAAAQHQVADLLQVQSASPIPTAKTTSTLYRITDIFVERFDGAGFVATDSGHLSYTGIRGSNIFGNDLRYDDFYYYAYDAATTMWENAFHQSQTFNAQNLAVTYNQRTWNGSTSTWENNYMLTHTYDGNNDRVQTIQKDWDAPTSTFENYERINYSYDAGHNLMQEVSQLWNNGTSSWENNSRTTYTYTAGKLDFYIYQYWNSGTSAWVNSAKHIFTYDGAGNMTSDINQLPDGSNWKNAQRYIYTWNSTNGQETNIRQTWNTSTNSWNNETRVMYTYNSLNLPATQEIKTWNTGSSSWEFDLGDQRARLYYEQYTNSVKQLAASTGALTAYPIPAANNITITLKNAEPGDAAVTVFDVQGRVVMEWHEQLTANFSKTIPVSDLAAGTYTIAVRTGSAIETCRFVKAQ